MHLQLKARNKVKSLYSKAANTMKALILLGTLKKDRLSNTEVLSEFLNSFLVKQGVECQTIKLVDHNILPGTYSNMGKGDDWPIVLEQVLDADILIFATPIWWNNQSSEIQRVIERLDELHDEILEGKESRLNGKVGGVVITGDSDGAQHIIANISNFFNALGVLMPPFATISVLIDKHEKGKENTREELLAEYKKEYTEPVEKMVKQLVKYVSNRR